MAGMVWMFSGQGAQRPGMAKDLFDSFDAVKALFKRADELLDLPLSRYVLEGPEEILRDTAVQQPAIMLASLAALKALQIVAADNGAAIPPVAALGLSLGEYTALCAAGSLSEDDALRLVRKRGELMKKAADACPGGMASILGATAEAVETACREAAAATGALVAAANYNCPGQIVIGGQEAGLAKAIEILKSRGAGRAVRLKVSGAFHTALMEPAREALREELRRTNIARASFDVIANVSASPVREPEDIRRSLEMQMTSPVRFEQSVRFLIGRGANRFVELGPGGILAGMVKRMDAAVAAVPCGTLGEIRGFVGSLAADGGAMKK